MSKYDSKGAAILKALSEADVGDNIVIHSEDGRVEYLVVLKIKEVSK